MTQREIFSEAIQIEDPARRAVFLDEACGDDSALRQDVEELLAQHEKDASFFLDRTPVVGSTVEMPAVAAQPGMQIGPYKLLQEIGRGGMGVVYMAEQIEPVLRRVALKIIKPGMNTKQVIARFESERQALAMMDHPNIAKVLDAGTTESGHPYFVMELVRGIPITEYCDQQHLTPKERLELFIPVCQAIQHAHQKGIIHRDLKPSNILVALHDGRPVPMVIDFGVAKAIHQRLTEKTIFTEFGQVIGTLEYMSPEQAEVNQLDIDTRSDIYSLGVLLYELLTGCTPFDRKRLKSAAFDEMLRIIREEEPLRPSVRLSTLVTLPSVAAHRKIEPKKLSTLVRGELDWIVMKALEKDRARRYGTAIGLAEDIEHYLRDEPIEARSPSVAYRFSKFARRNRIAVVTAGLVLVSLILGIVGTGWMARVAGHQADLAEAANDRLEYQIEQKKQTVAALVEASYGEAVAAAVGGDREKAQEAIRMAKATGASIDRIEVLEGLIALNGGRFEQAVHRAETLLDRPSMASSAYRIGALALLSAAAPWDGYFDRAERYLNELRRLPLQTDTDHLLFAYGLVSSDPIGALRALQSRPRIQHSPAGLLIRAQARLLIASGSRDAQLIEGVLNDFQYVEFLFRDATLAAWRCLATGYAIHFAQLEGRSVQANGYSEMGRPLADRLLNDESLPAAHLYTCWMFYQAVGDNDAALRALHRFGKRPSALCFYLAAHCLATGTSKPFDDIFTRDERSEYVRIARAHLIRGAPMAASRVRALVRDLTDNPSPYICRHALTALCLTNDLSEVQELARDAAARMSEFDDRNIGAACVRFLAGEIDATQLLALAGGNGWARVNAHFTIGMMRLAAQDRHGAYQQFDKAVATNMFGAASYAWSSAYLARLDTERD